MESVHGVDVSWMSKHSNNANNSKGTFADGMSNGAGHRITNAVRPV